MTIADHPYLACLMAFALGGIAGWLATSLARLPRPDVADDDITGICA